MGGGCCDNVTTVMPLVMVVLLSCEAKRPAGEGLCVVLSRLHHSNSLRRHKELRHRRKAEDKRDTN
jgi:hypothetical protein